MEIGPRKLEDRVGAAIIAAGQAFAEPRWRAWARRWVRGKDRSAAAAHIAFAIADAEVEARGAGPAPPAGPGPAVAARTAALLAIEIKRIEGLREVGEGSLARTLEQNIAAVAARAGTQSACYERRIWD
jgi:hypothetical protein